ncbi:hypothetical protein [Moorena sp. SIO3B2]|uniref:hypothetical protein n=1 Tax=Moorena sp. SIO3B2 TaxID=2607827 RepID=UPI0013CAA821|nr:hypothetical protein [Moorena sp. SIO3B2]NEP33883.1 hypothetical protein [Moorena sp. SIO3B2]
MVLFLVYHFWIQQRQKYGWQLVDIEETGNPVLEVDCVFEGKTEFPKSYYKKFWV